MQGLNIRIARALNRRLERSGRVFADHLSRTHLEISAGNETRLALRAEQRAQTCGATQADATQGMDRPCSSGPQFEGWSRQGEPRTKHAVSSTGPPLPTARTWLLRSGWREKHGPLHVDAVPG
jgi:hypothetical protein